MAVDRGTPIAGPQTGEQMAIAINEEISALWDRSVCELTSVGGTANAITANVTPDFGAGGIKSGMSFLLTAAATNTGGVTLNIDGIGAYNVLSQGGEALSSGQIQAGWTYVLVFTSGTFRIVAPPTVAITRDYQEFTTAGTFLWNKPAGVAANAQVIIEAVGAGGGGGSSGAGGNIRAGGGGGGGFARRVMRASQIASQVTVTVGAGGAAGTSGGSGATGGNSSFGSHLTAFGGGGGYGINTLAASGGAGGGIWGAGEPALSAAAGGSGANGGGAGGYGDASNTPPGPTAGSRSEFGGGGGGGAGISPNVGMSGGASVWGGGGGAGAGTGSPVGGTSRYAGDGGGVATNGLAPGGGGGGGNVGGAGATGIVRVWVIG